MTKEEAIKYLQQLYPNGGHCWLDEQRIEAIGMAIKALKEEPSKFDAAIQEGDDVRYNEDLGCRVNLSQLKRVAKKEEPVSEDLIEATNNYTLNVRKGYPRVMDETDRYICNAFKAGAKWQKEQMMANAADMVVGYWMPNGLMLTVDEAENCYNIDEGDRVKVIIIKED